MIDVNALIDDTERRFGLPRGILHATRAVESSGGKHLHSGQADGSMQFAPATARTMGIDPMDDSQAIPAAGKLWADNLKAAGGDVDRAAMMYHGGPNTKIWGPKTHAYPAKIAAALPKNNGSEADNLISMLGGAAAPQSAPASESDALISQLTGGANASPNTNPQGGNPAPSGSFRLGGPVGAAPLGNDASGIQPMAGTAIGGQLGGSAGNGGNVSATAVGKRPTGLGNRLLRGVEDVTDTALQWGASGLDKVMGEKWAHGYNARDLIDAGIKSNDARYTAPEGIDAARIGGNIVGTAPLAALSASKVPMLARALQTTGAARAAGVAAPAGARLASTLARVGEGAVQGGGGAALLSSANGKSEADNATTGAEVGAGLTAALGATGRVLSPAVAKSVKVLQDLGVPMTGPQILAAGGGALGKAAKWAEDASSGLPFTGQIVGNGLRRGEEALNRNLVGRALGKIGVNIPDNIATGHEAIAFAQKAIGDTYDKLASSLTLRADKPFANDIMALAQKVNAPNAMTPALAKKFNYMVEHDVQRRFTNGTLSGEAYREIDRKLGAEAATYRKSSDPDNQHYADALESLQNSFRDLGVRTNPKVGEQLAAANSAHADMVRIERAASSAGAEGGKFTPAQLAAAVRSTAGGVRNGNRTNAAGKARMQDVADAAKSVLSSKIGDSGTSTRTTMANLVGANGLLKAGDTALGLLLQAPIMATSAIVHEPHVQKLIEALLTKRGATSTAVGTALRGNAQRAALPAATATQGQR